MRRALRIAATGAAAALLATATLVYAALAPSSNLFGQVVARAAAHPAAPRVALTFDDGPDPQVTPRVLDVLREAGAKATFFLVGERAERCPDIVRRIALEGHAIGNHSLAHRALPLLAASAIRADLARTQDVLNRSCGASPRWFRPPYGLRDPRVLDVARDLGLETVLWSVSPSDWREPAPELIRERTRSDLFDGAIVLLHDGDAANDRGRPNVVAALPGILADLRALGFEAVTLDRLLGEAR